jgi:hypothetical protein
VNSGTFNYTGGTFTGSFTNNSGAVLDLGGGQQRILDGPLLNGGELRVSAGTPVNVTGGVTGTGSGASATGVVRVDPGSSLEMPYVRQQALHAGGTARVRATSTGGQTSRLQTLDISGSPGAWTGRIDLADTALIIDYSGATSPQAAVSNQIRSGHASGSWGGNGITSSSAAAVPGTALGYAEASQVLGAAGGTFRGQPADATAVLVRHTLYGDANLDGSVNGSDFALLAGNFGRTGQFWYGGDFNYDLSVDGSDFALLAGNFGKTAPAAAGGCQDRRSLGYPGGDGGEEVREEAVSLADRGADETLGTQHPLATAAPG